MVTCFGLLSRERDIFIPKYCFTICYLCKLSVFEKSDVILNFLIAKPAASPHWAVNPTQDRATQIRVIINSGGYIYCPRSLKALMTALPRRQDVINNLDLLLTFTKSFLLMISFSVIRILVYSWNSPEPTLGSSQPNFFKLVINLSSILGQIHIRVLYIKKWNYVYVSPPIGSSPLTFSGLPLSR